jgi:aminopeptidase N
MDNVGSLAHDEAKTRADLLDVERYDIAVDLTGIPETEELRCVSRISFRSREGGASTFVDCAAEVVSASLNGRDIGTAVDQRIELTDLEEDNVLEVETVQRRTTQGNGVNRIVDPADKEVYLWTSFEPDEARFAWACFDQPDLKAPHAFTVIAPERWTVLSNSGDPTVTDPEVSGVGDGRRWVFPETPPLSTYVVVVNAGPFCERRTSRDGFELGLYSRKSLESMLERDADELFELTATGLAFFGDRFGMPFPQASYDQVFVPGLGGAMENYGCVTWGDYFIFRNEPSPDERHLRARVLLHEMAHMWFGDIVTMKWWDDLWLNESFAEWACHWAAEEATEFTDAWANFLASYKLAAYSIDRGPTTHPIRQPAGDVAEATARFDAITYTKGASVLKQLVAFVGEDQFVAGLRTYFAKYAWGNAVFADLVEELSAASGRDLVAWAAGWLDQAGPDTLAVDRVGDETLLRREGPDGAPGRPHRVDIGVYRRTGDSLTRADLLELEVFTPVTALDAARVGEGRLLLINDEDLTYASVRPDETSIRELLANAAKLPTEIARVMAISTGWDLLVDGQLDAGQVVRSIISVLQVETSDSIVEVFLDRAVNATERWSAEAQRPILLEQVADLCVELAQNPARRVIALRALARTAVTDEQLAVLANVHNDPDLEWHALRRFAALGKLDRDQIGPLRDRDPNPDAWLRAVEVEAAEPTASAKEHAWNAIVVERTVPIDAVSDVIRAFWQAGQDDVLAPFADRYLDELPRVSKMSMIPAMTLSYSMFPIVGTGPEFLPRVETAVSSDDISPTVKHRVQEAADQFRRMLAARTRDTDGGP